MTNKGLLKGMTRAWFECYRDQINIKGYALNQRPKGRFGIAIDNDIHALEYQIADYKAYRAGIALTGLTCLSSWSVGVTKSSEEAKENGRQETIRMLKDKRKRAMKARLLLRNFSNEYV